METFKLDSVLKLEAQQLKTRRRLLFGDEAAEKFEKEKFGIAMSGGGIRSATINLGFLRTLNLYKILEKADYLSTVSGGGYTGAYVQATLKEKNGYKCLFEESKITHLRSYGNYLVPGQSKWTKLWNTLVLIISFLVSWLMSLLSPAVVVAIAVLIFKMIASTPFFEVQNSVFDWKESNNVVMEFLRPFLYALGIVLLIHLIFNLVFNFNLKISKRLSKIESVLGVFIAVYLLLVGIITLDTSSHHQDNYLDLYPLIIILLFVTGYLLNPNSLSFHRFYRNQLADAFLSHTETFGNMLLHKVSLPDGSSGQQQDYLAPFPLINSCLNLQNPGGGEKFKGAKASDYFLLSSLFCGSKLSGYVKTSEFPGFRRLTLPAAITISAAAVNPGMGIYSNKVLSILMTLFNARLGFWVNNPSSKLRQGLLAWTNYIVWWPSYFFKELLAKINTENRKLNISDGGHIENLAVYELLRRKCRLIFSVDAGADPESTFSDLENLSIRARNELGIDISFRAGQDPVDVIRSKPSSGYAQRRFALADLLQVWEEFYVKDENNQPCLFTKKIMVDGKPNVKTSNLEALVNYFYNKKEPSELKFRVDLKAEKGVDISEAEYENLRIKTIEQVKKILDERPGKPGIDKIKVGLFVYIKSSVTPPRKLYVPEYGPDGKKNPEFDTFKYKIYHPEFPQESTADQFFDPVQWESYYQLGQHIAKDVLNAPHQISQCQYGVEDVSIDDLLKHFDGSKSLFEEVKVSDDGVVDAYTAVDRESELEIAPPKTPEIPDETSEEQQDMAKQMQFNI